MIGNFIIRLGSTVPWLDVQLTKTGFVDLNLQAPKPKGCADDDCGDKDDLIDLTDADVRFELFKCGRVPAQVATMGLVEILDATCGMVRYKWAPTDLDCQCLYYGRFRVAYPDNTILLWPYAIEQLTIEVM